MEIDERAADSCTVGAGHAEDCSALAFVPAKGKVQIRTRVGWSREERLFVLVGGRVLVAQLVDVGHALPLVCQRPATRSSKVPGDGTTHP